jgi:hypothetical protein
LRGAARRPALPAVTTFTGSRRYGRRRRASAAGPADDRVPGRVITGPPWPRQPSGWTAQAAIPHRTSARVRPAPSPAGKTAAQRNWALS